MPKLPRVKPFKVIKALKGAGFYIDHITGSHYILYQNDKITTKNPKMTEADERTF